VKLNKEELKNYNIDSLVSQDTDHDGIDDMNDDVIDSTENTKVDVDGIPIDTDDDGIPDYRDKEPKSEKDALVDEEGVTITEEMMEEKWKADSLSALPVIIEYLHHTDKFGSSASDNGANSADGKKSGSAPIPVAFRGLDTDKNNQISPAEITTAIDEYLDGKSKFTVAEFYELIDFFFSQH
jgi:OOP family OmpA-OmpF porin